MIAKKFEEVKNEKIELNNFWSEKIQTLENKTKDDKEHFKDAIMKKASEAENLIKQEQLKLKELFEEKKQKIKEVDMKLKTQKKKIPLNVKSVVKHFK